MVPAAADDPDLSAPELDQHATDVRNAAVMSVGTLLSRVTGLVRVSVTVAAIGTTGVVTDAYYVANTTPNIVYELILGGILTSVFVPLLVDWAKRYGQNEGRIAGQRFLTFVLVVLSLYIWCTPVGSRTASIHHGRYLLPLLPVALVLVPGKLPPLLATERARRLLAAVSTGLMLVLALVTVVTRYHLP